MSRFAQVCAPNIHGSYSAARTGGGMAGVPEQLRARTQLRYCLYTNTERRFRVWVNIASVRAEILF